MEVYFFTILEARSPKSGVGWSVFGETPALVSDGLLLTVWSRDLFVHNMGERERALLERH